MLTIDKEKALTLPREILLDIYTYSERLEEAGIAASVGSVGDAYDNALAETINGLYKAEVIHRMGPWKGFDDVEYATLEWVDWGSVPIVGVTRRPSEARA